MKTQDIDMGSFVIPNSELDITVSTSGGPGGQHANKTSTKVTLRWCITDSKVLSFSQKKMLENSLQARLTTSGELLVSSSDTRSQHQNYTLAVHRFRKLIKKALHKPKTRRPTKPSKASIKKRITNKKQRGEIKKLRQQPSTD